MNGTGWLNVSEPARGKSVDRAGSALNVTTGGMEISLANRQFTSSSLLFRRPASSAIRPPWPFYPGRRKVPPAVLVPGRMIFRVLRALSLDAASCLHSPGPGAARRRHISSGPNACQQGTGWTVGDRWAIVGYLRALQASRHFPEAKVTDAMHREQSEQGGPARRKQKEWPMSGDETARNSIATRLLAGGGFGQLAA